MRHALLSSAIKSDKGKQKQEVVIELKIRCSTTQKTIISQTWEYMDKCGASEGHLVIFDQRKRKSWKEKIFMRKESINDCKFGSGACNV